MLENTAALRDIVHRLDHIADQRESLNADAKVVYDEARAAGFNVKAVRQLVAEGRMDRDALDAYNETIDEYRQSLGEFADTPLGRASEPVMHDPAPMPTPFAEQTVHDPKRPRGRGRPRKDATELWSRRADETIGTA